MPGLFKRLQNPIPEIEKHSELKKAPPVLLGLGFFISVFFFNSPTFQFILNGYIVFVLYKIHQATENLESPEDQKMRSNYQKGGYGLLVVTLLVFMFGGPENYFTPRALQGTWYNPTTCEVFEVDSKAGIAAHMLYNKKATDDIYQAENKAENEEYKTSWSTEHKFLTASVSEEIIAIQHKIRDADKERKKLFVDKSIASWSDIPLNLPMNGGIEEDGVYVFESYTFLQEKGEATFSTNGNELTFSFDSADVWNHDKDFVFTFTKEKPQTCTNDPIGDIEKTLTSLVADIEQNMSKIPPMLEADKKARGTAGSKATVSHNDYPHPCDNLDPEMHIKIAGTDNLCLLNDTDFLLKDIQFGMDFSVPSTFDDDEPLSYFVSPYNCKSNGLKDKESVCETSEYSSSSREAEKKKQKNTIYQITLDDSDCTKEYSNDKYTIKFTCNLPKNMYASGSANFKETKECEQGEYTSCGECSSNSDCHLGLGFFSGCLSGCDSARCVWGQCTACYQPGDCDYTYEMKGIKPFVFSKTFTAETYEEGKKIAQKDLLLLFKPVSGYRKIYVHKSKYSDDKEVTGNSSIWIQIAPEKVLYDKTILYGKSSTALQAMFKKTDIQITCDNDVCTARKF